MVSGHPTPLPARLVREAVCEAMGSAVPEGFRPQRTTPATIAAGTDEPERVAVDGVAADAAVFDTDAATSYRDGVKHDGESVFLSALSERIASFSLRETPLDVPRHVWECASCEYQRLNPAAKRGVSYPREMRKAPLQTETLF